MSDACFETTWKRITRQEKHRPPVLAAVKGSFSRPGNFTFTGTVLVPLNAGGATTVSFSGAGKFAITYAAECAEAGTPGNWVSLQILVDGVALDPTAGTADAFCAGNSTAGFDGWATQSITVVTPALGTGGHTLQVQATDVGTAGGWLGDSSLVVQK